MSHSLPPCDGRHHFFELRSFNMALSSIASANSFFSFAYLVGKDLEAPSFRYVQATILGLPLKNVALLIPCLRQTSPVFEPASCSRRIAMIRSSVNLDCFISVSLKAA